MSELNLLDIIPLEPLLADSPDSYSYSGEAPVGSLVRISFGRKIIEGVVVRATPLRGHKLAVKASPYTLKPIIEVITTGPLLTDAQLDFGRWLADHTNRSLPFIATLLTQFQKKCLPSFAAPIVHVTTDKTVATKIVPKLDQSLLKSKPNLILVPHESYCSILAEQFPEALVVDLSLPLKQRCSIIEQIAHGKKTIFIAAKHSIFLPWQKLQRVIVLDEGSGFYKDPFKPPYLDYIPLIERLAAGHGAELILVDSFPSLRRFVDEKKLSRPTLNFETVATGDLGAVTALIRSAARTIVCSPQRLLAQRIRCDACRTDLSCQRCHGPLTVNEGEMLCRLCGTSYPLVELCPRCNEPLRVWGTGAQWLGRHLRREGISAITVETAEDLDQLRDHSHFTAVGSLTLMTPRLPQADLVIFTDFDRAYHAADIFIRERYLRLLHFLARYAKRVVLQTELASDTLEQISNGTIIDDILSERRALNLPPYTRLIKLTSRLQDLTKLTERMNAVRKEIEKRAATLSTSEGNLTAGLVAARAGMVRSRPQAWSGARARQRTSGTLGRESRAGGQVGRAAAVEILGPFPRKLAKRRSRYQLELALKIDPSINLRELLHGLRIEEVEIDAVSMD